MASDSTPNISGTSFGEVAPSPKPGNWFVGPKGLRAGWRIAIFLLIVVGLGTSLGLIVALTPAGRDFAQTSRADAQRGVLTPTGALLSEGLVAFIVLAAAGIMALIEKRSFADYGLPWNQAFGKRFWQGLPLGFGALSLLLVMIWALHGFSLDGLAVNGGTAVKYGIEWFIAFFLVGVFEDFTFRGYLQSALGDGIGFWPAAIILAICFGGIHYGNSGEAIFGCVMAGSFGLLEAFALSRVGSLWLLFGMHASWDWGETYFYGTPDSGALGLGHLFNSSFHGPKWLTGGTVGPEGSWLVFLVLIIWALAIHFLFPAKSRQAT
jgi:membrane protease YdiL (CAAX protease family)